MATVEYWIQIENHAWDVCPKIDFDRLTGLTIAQVTKDPSKVPTPKNLVSPVTGARRDNVTMNLPLSEDALILRRYTANWAAPDDRKVNPWDLNEPDPTDAGTMGTIPGPVIECNVGDKVIVHFRNMDQRATPNPPLKIFIPFPPPGHFIDLPIPPTPFPIPKRTHSLHPHGFAFAPTSDGAYPLTPVDPTQNINDGVHDETAAWAGVNVTGQFKQGDRVPQGGTFTYTWIAGAPNEDDPTQIEPWPTTSGVWLYHDHSICDMENVKLGALGIIVIHNPDDPQDVTVGTADLPGGSPNGSPITFLTLPFPFPPIPVGTLPHDLALLGQGVPGSHGMPPMHGMTEEGHAMTEPMGAASATSERSGRIGEAGDRAEHPQHGGQVPPPELTLRHGDLLFEVDKNMQRLINLHLPIYRRPPDKAQFLLLLHTLTGAGGMEMCINGRKYLGNTPTVVARAPQKDQTGQLADGTLMRFGVVGMGSEFHTFHLHGHRWAIPGPDGNLPGGGGTDPGAAGAVPPFGTQFSPQVKPVSQFEDTRIFGPANSFVFSIQEGEFMGAIETAAKGEWHMHCHVLMHMDDGMMGSLLVVNGGESALFPLPKGDPTLACDMPDMGPGGAALTATVRGTSLCHWIDDTSHTSETTIKVGGTVTWIDAGGCGPSHTVVSDNGSPFDMLMPPLNLAVPVPPNTTGVSRTFTTAGSFGYHCGIHGGDPSARTGMWGIVHVVP